MGDWNKPHGGPGGSTEYERGEGKEAGVIIPSPRSPLPSASREAFHSLRNKLSGRGMEPGQEKGAGEMNKIRPGV